MAHLCLKDDCPKLVGAEHFACRDHWYSLPKDLRDEIWREYRKEPGSARSIVAIVAAVKFLNGEKD